MYAIIRESTIKSEAPALYAAAGKQLGDLRAQQPGYRGNVAIDAGDGRRVAVTLWESEETQAAARLVLSPHAERLLGPHWAVPAKIVYQGPVVADDLGKGSPFAVIRESNYRPGGWAQSQAAREEFLAIRAQQPGYQGTTTLDAGDGRIVTFALWESEQAANAATPILRPHAERLMGPVWSRPIEIVYQGSVVSDDRTTP